MVPVTSRLSHTHTHSHADRDQSSPLTDTPQALLVQAPDEVSTQVAPRGLSVAAGLEVVSLSFLLCGLRVVGTAQNSDDAHAAQHVWDFPRADSKSVGSFQTRRRAGDMSVHRLRLIFVCAQLTELDELTPRHHVTQRESGTTS